MKKLTRQLPQNRRLRLETRRGHCELLDFDRVVAPNGHRRLLNEAVRGRRFKTGFRVDAGRAVHLRVAALAEFGDHAELAVDQVACAKVVAVV